MPGLLTGRHDDVNRTGLSQILPIAAEDVPVIGVVEVQPENDAVCSVDQGATAFFDERASPRNTRPSADDDLVPL